MLLTPDSEPPGATGESTITHTHKTIHMWMGQGQNVKGFGSGYMATPMTALGSLSPTFCSQRPGLCPSIP